MSGPNNVGGDPIAAQVPNMNVLQVFYAGTDGGLYTLWRDPITGWNQPAPMSGAIDVRGTPEAATLPNNTNIRQVFYRALDNGLYTLYRDPNAGWSQPVLTATNVGVIRQPSRTRGRGRPSWSFTETSIAP